MTHIWNDPAEFTADAVAGFARLYAGHVRPVPGGVVRRHRSPDPKVAVVIGGGSGHYPAFAGLVGPGLADGAAIGNVFASPSPQQVYSVARAASRARRLLAYGNYAGDVINFGLAGERLRAEGTDTRQVVVTDDVASAPVAERASRRGIAGDLVVFKVLGRPPNGASTSTRSSGSAGAPTSGRAPSVSPSPAVRSRGRRAALHRRGGADGAGLGIHGEPGLERRAAPTRGRAGRAPGEPPARGATRRTRASRVAVIAQRPRRQRSTRSSSSLWTCRASSSDAAGLAVVAPEVGEFVTSLDMAGVSLTLCLARRRTRATVARARRQPAFRRGSVAHLDAGVEAEDAADVGPVLPDLAPEGDEGSRRTAEVVVDALRAVASAMRDAERLLGDLDAVAGDGDHGRGMLRGAEHALAAAAGAAAGGWGAAGVLVAAGDAWGEHAGGTSGVLWGAGLRAMGGALGNAGRPGADDVRDAVGAFLDAVTGLGKAEAGDKTLVDAALPFRDRLAGALDAGAPLADAWTAAADAATAAAEATAELSPRTGRARPLAARSVGSPDPGAVSFARCVTAVGEVLVSGRTG